MMKQLWVILALILILILVLHLEQQLTVRYGELRHHRAHPEHTAVHCDVTPEDLGVNPPWLQSHVKRLVTRPHPPLHHPNFGRIHVIPGALYVVGVVAVALVGLDLLVRLKKVLQNLVNFLCWYTYRQGMDPESIPSSPQGCLCPHHKPRYGLH